MFGRDPAAAGILEGVTSKAPIRAIPTGDRAWLLAALTDALDGGTPVLPVPDGSETGALSALQRLPESELPEGTALVILTSGSSGVPKAVALSASALRASAEATHERLGGPGQWIVALPTYLISGVQMLVRSIVCGSDPVFFDDPSGRPFDPAAFLDACDAADGGSTGRRYVSLVPVQFARLLELAEQDPEAADRLRAIDGVLVGGQAVTLEMRRRAHALGVRLRRSYGMTETAGGCVYDGVEIGDTRVRIRAGEVQLAGPSLALGYIGDPVLTAEKFVEELGRDGVPTRWYRTGDAGELLGGMLTVTGRLDRVLVSGGVNVSLDEIERIAREHEGWDSAVAVRVPDAEWGERPGLVVEIADPTGAARTDFDAIRAVIREQLGAAAAPEWSTEIDRMPRLPGGKPDLRAIDEWIGRLRASFAETRAAGSAAAHSQEDDA